MNKFFWYKSLLLLSSNYWPFSLCKILNKFLQRIQSYEDASFLGPKWFIIFIYLLSTFILQNFQKILPANPELWGCAIFRPKIPKFVLKKIFWYKPLLLLSSTYWQISLGKILEILSVDPELWGCANFGPKMVHLPPKIFFGKLLISLSSTY